ncbi:MULTISPECIES: hypothetical protein [Paenibacillus]|uniref:hypothetical protein n=1 Tax=Paenibacillus TaxID=44249 RepID=UPI00038F8BEC|nr:MULTISPECIES: hypothetical protein [Paenibacillus]CDN41182.1 hypothetical protein BN871_AC_00760 [Paenibacillus sp. P22]
MIDNAEIRKRQRREKDFVIYGWATVVGVFLTPLVIGILFAAAGVIVGYHVKKKYGRDTMGVAIMVGNIAAIPVLTALLYTLRLFG